VSTQVDIGEAGASDVAAIALFLWELWRESGPDSPGLTGATEEVIAEIAAPDAIRARIGGPERRMFLARAEGAVVGFAATRVIDAGHIELAGIMVLQRMIGQHIGTPLVEAAIKSARDQGHKLMTVSTEIDNERAVGFYQARGFAASSESTEDVEGTAVAVVELEFQL
jgi:ribosomal protein S18 acetylase RimI-like enzyme